MTSFEQAAKRLFADPDWVGKVVVGGLLLLPPFTPWSGGFLLRMALRAARGDPAEWPAWEDWLNLYLEGLRFLLLFLALGVAPVLAAWAFAQPFRPYLGPVAYLPMTPALLAAPGLLAAGFYRWMDTGTLGAAFRPLEVWALLMEHRAVLLVPTLAFLGLGAVAFPVLPWALFAGLAVFLPGAVGTMRRGS